MTFAKINEVDLNWIYNLKMKWGLDVTPVALQMQY